MRQCTNCKNNFEPSSGHKHCPKCRSKARSRVKCIGCGNVISYERKSKRCKKCVTQQSQGILNGNWKGGKTYHRKGYVLIRCPNHPRMTQSGKYVFEHILVMEQKLGRFLEKGEKVHHRNLIKSDNSPKNLELWISSHPTGARMSDMVAFAKEILRKYEPDALTLGFL